MSLWAIALVKYRIFILFITFFFEHENKKRILFNSLINYIFTQESRYIKVLIGPLL